MDNCSEDASWEQTQKILFPVLLGPLAIFGVGGNILVLTILAVNRLMRSPMDVLICNLAIADLLYLIVCLPFTIWRFTNPEWIFGSFTCKLFQYTLHVTTWGSIYTMTFMTILRFVAIVRDPTKSVAILRHPTRVILCLLILWIIICAVNIPVWQGHDVAVSYNSCDDEHTLCAFDDQNYANQTEDYFIEPRKLFHLTFFTFGYCLPLFVICVLYGLILRELLYTRNHPIGEGSSQEIVKSRNRAARLVLCIVGSFAICWFPLHLFTLLFDFGALTLSNVGTYIAMNMILNFLSFLSACINPILYSFLSENFKIGFRNLLACKRFQVKFQHNNNSTYITDQKTHTVTPPLHRGSFNITVISSDTPRSSSVSTKSSV